MISALLGIPLSWITILLVMKLSRPGFLAAPRSHRSNHEGSPQQIGGIGIAVCGVAAAAMAMLDGLTPAAYLLTAACALLFATGLADDLLDLPTPPRLVAQLLGAYLLVVALAPAQVTASWLALPASVAIAYWINAVNFMDGLDLMLVAGLGIPLAFALSIMILTGPQPGFATSLGLWSLAGLLGFAVWNRPPARIFMGDSGALLLGGISAAVIVALASTVSLLVAVMPFLYFLTDTAETVIRRLLAGENIFQAHSRHAYQLAFRNGRTATQLALTVAAISLTLGLSAWLCMLAGTQLLTLTVFAVLLLSTFAFTGWLRNA